MRRNVTSRRGTKRSESGVALLIAIFALLLISVVAIALVISSGTDSALAGNYRTASGAYYASVAGLEEARGRLLWKNPDFINKSSSYTNLLFDSSGVIPAWGLTQVLYITNPAPGETVNPTSSNPAFYPDTEYGQEFPSWGLSGATVYQIPSVSPVASQSLPGPSYKWARINPITEQSLNIDVNGDGILDGAGVLFYDPAHVNPLNPTKLMPGLVVGLSSTPPQPPTWVQALEITSLAVMPNGSRRLLQYVVAPVIVSTQASSTSSSVPRMPFPAALTLLGNGVTYLGPETASFFVNGQDQCAGSSTLVYSLGYTNPADQPGIVANVTPASNYKGYPPGAGGPPPPPTNGPGTAGNIYPTPSTSMISPTWLTPATLDGVVQDIENSADVVITGPATGTDISNKAGAMSAANPMTIVVNGDLDLNAWHHVGFGLLLVTGTLKYDPDATWEGIVLVIGQGSFVSTKSGMGGIDGALLLAKTRDSSNNLLTSLGPTSFSQTGFGGSLGKGINYNSCWISPPSSVTPPIAEGQGPLTYKVLSFHELPTN